MPPISTNPDSLLIMDNFGAHINVQTEKVLNDNNINSLALAKNTTPICQPVDVGMGGTIKSKIKKYYHEWVIDNWDEHNNFYTYNPKKKKYKIKTPSKSLIIDWIIPTYNEVESTTTKRSNFYSF